MTDHRREAADLQRRFEALAAEHPDVPLAMFEMPLHKPARELVERYVMGLNLPTFALFDDWFTVAMEPDAAHATVRLLARAGDVLRSIERQMPGTVGWLTPVGVNQTPNPDKLAACAIILGIVARRVDVEAVKAGRPSDGWEQIDAVAELFEGGPEPASTRLMVEWHADRERWGSLLVVPDIHKAAAEVLREALDAAALRCDGLFSDSEPVGFAETAEGGVVRFDRRTCWAYFGDGGLGGYGVLYRTPGGVFIRQDVRWDPDKGPDSRKRTIRLITSGEAGAWFVEHDIAPPADLADEVAPLVDGAGSGGLAGGDGTPAGGPPRDAGMMFEQRDAHGFIITPADETAYVSAAGILANHIPVSMDIATPKQLTRVLDDNLQTIRQWRPGGRRNRRSVHLGDWLKHVELNGGNGDGWASPEDAEATKARIRAGKAQGK